MERLQGHINQIMTLECLEQERAPDYHSLESYMISEHHIQMPFLRMLLEEHGQQPAPSETSSFQLLLRLQEERLHHQQPLQHPRLFQAPCSAENWQAENDAWPRPLSLELESCVTHVSESLSDAMNHHHHHEQHHPHQQQQRTQPPSRWCKREPSPATGPATKASIAAAATPATTEPVSTVGEKRKRKRPQRPAKNVEDLESQRMTHIAVERNRRKLMNEYLGCLRSLMPPSFVQRADQASIIGGAIDFVKELEQLLQSLQAEKRTQALRSRSDGAGSSTAAAASPFHDFFTSPQYTTYMSPTPSSSSSSSSASCPLLATKAEEQAAVADVEATVVQTHVNLRVLTPRRPAQLLRAVAALEELHLSVLHLNITSLDDSVFYSLNLKIEEDCKLGSADEIAAAAHHIFFLINSTA